MAHPQSSAPDATGDASPRAVVARHALLGAALLGIAADPLLRNPPWGLGLLVWMAAFAVVVVVVVVRRVGRPLSREGRIWLGVALLSAASLSWRDAAMLQVFDVLAMLMALVLLAMSMASVPVPGIALARVRDLLLAGFGTGLDVATGAIPLVLRDAELHTGRRASSGGSARRIARALAITAPILIVFVLLLTNADPVFGSFFAFPELDLDVVLSHIIISGFFAWVVAGWLRRSLLTHVDESPDTPVPIALNATDVTIALGALNVLFAAFVVTQVGWLFGGETLVLRTTGLSYAEYARQGFFELACVAALLLPVLLGAQALIPASDLRTLRLYRRLALSLVVLLGVILVSAGARMNLYVRYYGISADRLYATAFMIWLAIVFAWLALTVLRSRPRTFAAGLVISGFAVLLTLNVLNPDALVARANLARGFTGRPGGADLRYLASLGGDAVPALVSELTRPTSAAAASAAEDRCTSARMLLERWTGKRQDEMAHSWTQWNVGRSGAAQAVGENESGLRQLACPETPVQPAPPPPAR